VAPADLHVTLTFLGIVSRELRGRLAADAHSRLSELPSPWLELGALDGFPNSAAATVLVSHCVEPIGAALPELVAATSEIARTHGVPLQNRRFRAHVTLARFRTPTDVRAALRPIAAERWRASAVELLVSVAPAIPRYVVEHSWPLR
jgi:2'-5' RNA ligase